MALQRCADDLVLGEMLPFSLVQNYRSEIAELVRRGVGELGIGGPRYCSDARIEYLLERKLVREIAWV